MVVSQQAPGIKHMSSKSSHPHFVFIIPKNHRRFPQYFEAPPNIETERILLYLCAVTSYNLTRYY